MAKEGKFVQREAIISVFNDFDFSNVATRGRKLAVSFVGNECDWIGVTCDTNGNILKIELSK